MTHLVTVEPSSRPAPAMMLSRRGLLRGAALAVLPGVAARAEAPANRDLRPFRVATPQEKLDRIAAKLRHTTLPAPMPPGDWQTGLDHRFIQQLRRYWLQSFDWREAERRLNQYPQFTARVGDQRIHFYHVRGEHPSAKPVLMTHGWPYSASSFLSVVDRLTHPSRFGGRAEDALTLILPSMPGYAFSDKPRSPQGPSEIAALWRTLMVDVLGYARFGAQGGDHGAVISTYLASQYPDHVAALHLNLVPVIPTEHPSAEERAWKEAAAAFREREFDYFRIQAGKPDLLSLALTDSPLGAAAWIGEKFNGWSDGGIAAIGGLDTLLTETMLYLLTDSIGSGFWYYHALQRAGGRVHPGTRIAQPTAVYLSPKEFLTGRPPREAIERSFNLVRLTRPARGGHFPFLEQPVHYADDVGSFFAAALRT